jgi:hypothetical protein
MFGYQIGNSLSSTRPMTNNKMHIYVETVLKVLLCKMYSMASFFPLFLDEIILERIVVIYPS